MSDRLADPSRRTDSLRAEAGHTEETRLNLSYYSFLRSVNILSPGLGLGSNMEGGLKGDIGADLERWYEERNDESVDNKIRIAYLFSPEWEQRLNPLWAAYDELEERRTVAGAPRLKWQGKIEEERVQFAKMRGTYFKPMTDRLRPLCPLWVHLARYQGQPEQDDTRRFNGWVYLLDSWAEMNRLFQNDQDFHRTLSPTQQRSYQLLCSWWESAYCDRELLDATVDYLESRRSFKTITDPSSDQNLERIAERVKTDTSAYHASLFRLFLFEFGPMYWEPYLCHLKLSDLQSARYQASCFATIQKLSYSTLHPGGTQRQPYPMVVQNDAAHQVMTLTQASVNPYYLWDCENQKTVVVGDMPECPGYVCISHTWGRWRTRTDTEVRGVPWAVPENTRFDVRDLPDQLSKIGPRYIWLDLFCVPQDKSPRANTEIANQASIFKGSDHCIAWINDVGSWDGVLKALDWISLKSLSIKSARDVDVLRERLSAAATAATIPMELMKRQPLPEGMPLLGRSSELASGEPSVWFSSLWTLQECVLCPEIELYSRAWGRLEDRSGSPISLRALMVFLRDTEKHCWLDGPINVPFASVRKYELAILEHPERVSQNLVSNWKYPSAVRDLYYLCMMTRLDNVLTTGSPTTILTNANLRQCTSNRAPAIMSAVGVTNWYVRALEGEAVGPLVFDKYPLSFLREAAQKFGAIFYESIARNLTRLRTASELRRIFIPAEREGSMLPITKSQGWFCKVTGSYEHTYIDRVDHAAVSTWTVNQDGSVTMPSVGIAMSSRDKPTERRVAGSVTCVTGDGGGVDETGRPEVFTSLQDDVLATLKELSHGSRRIYAVALYQDLGVLHGVLLEKLPGLVFGKQYLVKIGSFFMREVPLPSCTKVDWKVL